jgi:predicted peroxiredoxin
MPDSGKVVVNLMTGHEDAEKVTIAFLVATAALTKGKAVAMFLTKEAVRLGLPGYADAIEVAGAPPVQRLFEQYRDGGGELLVCRSASTLAGSTNPPLSATRAWQAPPRYGSGSATARRSSATSGRRRQRRGRIR